MKFVTFFIIIMWTIIGFTWQSVDVKTEKTSKWYRLLEYAIVAPVVVVKWVKIGISKLLNQ